MKICILAKRGKPYIREVVNFTKKFTTDIDLILGEKSELYPKQLHNHEYDILISYLSPWIVKKISLNQTKLYNLNFHPGPPKYHININPINQPNHNTNQTRANKLF